MDCYGRSFNKREECPECEHRELCESAADPKINHSRYNDSIKPDASLSDEPRSFLEQEEHNARLEEREAPRYSLEDVIFLIRKLLEIDELTFEYVKMKVINPAITLDEMAKKREKLDRKKKVLAVNRLGHVFEALTGINIARGEARKRFIKVLEEKPISREAVNKMLIKACKEHPELDLILRNRKHRKKSAC